MYNSLMRFNLKKNEKKLRFRGFEAVRGLIPHIFLVRPGGHMVLQLPCVAFFHPSLNWREKIFFWPFFKCFFLIGQ